MKVTHSFLFIVGLSLIIVACTSNDPKPDPINTSPKSARLACTDSLHPEMPVGEVIYTNPDTTMRSYSSLEIGKDSLIWFNYEKDMRDSSLFISVEKIVMAIKDIDSAKLETTEGDIELTTGGSIHTTGFFVRAINEEKRFKSVEYSCQNQNGEQSNYDIHTCNISTTNIETAKKLVERIRPLLVKKP